MAVFDCVGVIDRVGASSALSQEQWEGPFEHLLSLEGFRQVFVVNKSGWKTLYVPIHIDM